MPTVAQLLAGSAMQADQRWWPRLEVIPWSSRLRVGRSANDFTLSNQPNTKEPEGKINRTDISERTRQEKRNNRCSFVHGMYEVWTRQEALEIKNKERMFGRWWKWFEGNGCYRLGNNSYGYRRLENDLAGGQGPTGAAEPVKKMRWKSSVSHTTQITENRASS